MRPNPIFRLAAATVVLLGALSHDGRAQSGTTDSIAKRVTITPGSHYRAGRFTRILLGDGWRDVWVTPVTAPIFDPATFNGGLKFDKRGGGRQSITVHFKEEKGADSYVFRSVDKFPGHTLSPEFQGTLVGHVIQDQVSQYFPAAPLMLPPLLAAIGALHLEPRLVVMADSKMLGALRDTVGGMLGTFELKPKEGKGDTPGFAGSRKIEDTEELFETLRSSHNDRVDEREFLATRLIDFLINDTDRTPDNYAWARFGDKDSGYVWRAIPRDRDWAAIEADGLVNTFLISAMWPKFAKFTSKPKVSALTYSTFQLDRRLLQRLTSRDFQDVAVEVQRAVTDQVIARAVSTLPAEWMTTDAPATLTRVMRYRRDNLLATTMRFYRRIADDVDLHGTDLGDRVDIVRHNDGRVTVTIGPAQQTVAAAKTRRENGVVVTEVSGDVSTGGPAYYERTFIPPETQEIRVYLGKGDDMAVVSGAANKSIRVRVIGEEGNDVFEDMAYAGGTRFYDETGNDRVIAGPRLITRPFDAPTPTAVFRMGVPWRPDWGGKRGWGIAFAHQTGEGIAIGGGPRFTTYGFRRLPHQMKGGAKLLVSPTTGHLGAFGTLDYRMENSALGIALDARASQLEGFRFFGYGNDSPDMSSAASLVNQRALSVEPALVYRIGFRTRENGFNELRGKQSKLEAGEDSVPPSGLRHTVGKLTVGPHFAWLDAEPTAGSPIVTSGATGASGFSLAGVKLGLQLDRTDNDAMPTHGFTVRAAAAGYPGILGLDESFATFAGSATGYLPIIKNGPHLAMRLGGAVGTGDVPVQFAPAIGGRSSLRGYSSRRFTGDASANAGVELRVPVGTVNLIMKSRLGVFGLADAGRVWLDGASPGALHTSVGGGFWLAALGKSVSVAYAQGDAGKLYLRLGQSY